MAGNLSAAGKGLAPAQGMSWALGRSNVCHFTSACAPFLLDPNSSQGIFKSVFPLADQPISTLAMKHVDFREDVPITSEQKAK